MKEFRADLHIHSCLSPCAEAEMTPSAIVRQAKAVGLDMIAICDHNSVENVTAVARAGQRQALTVIPGIEINSCEEVHVVGLFADEDGLSRIQATVNRHLCGENDAALFGEQTMMDEWDQVISRNPRLLIGATDLAMEQVVDAIHDCGGLAVAAHIDRQRFSVIGQLGFIPEGLQLDAVEVSSGRFRGPGQHSAVLASSDAHCLRDIGNSSTSFLLQTPTLEEIDKALHNTGGRRLLIHMEDLSLHILDIVENSLSAGASWIKISLVEDTRKDLLLLEIQDNGKGMDAAMQGQALDPFYTTRSTRRVGLGLPLLAQAAQQCEGRLDIRSEPGQGTSVKALFRLSHPDLKPLGDISETLRTLLVGRPDLDLHFEYRQDDECIAQLGD
jgi:3',5'-nucleoside bisphosphate phosphatase